MIPPLMAIFSWPLVGLVLFKRLSFQKALLWTIIGGYLFLPEKVKLDLPVLPAISKATMPAFIGALAAALVMSTYLKSYKSTSPPPDRVILKGWLPRDKVALTLFLGLLIGEVLTVLTNGDTLRYGRTVLPGLSLYDAGSRVLTTLMMLMPMLLARKCLATPEQHRLLLYTMVIAALIYTIPILWEARMSPQLNLHVYGRRVDSWIQHVRGGGYRPVVFLHHGLWLAIFMASCVIAAVCYIRLAAPSKRVIAMAAAGWLLIVLVLMNSLGGLLIAILLVIPAFFLTVRMQMLIAAGLTAVVLLYPMMRGTGTIPVDLALEQAARIDVDRAASLGFRIRNEDVLLEKARQRPLFGWGSWGRNQVFDEEGNDISVTDGRWVIEIGSNGWLGYLTRFGLLGVPILILAFRRKTYPTDTATAGVVLMLTANLLDLIPNATLTPITWLLAGALIGRLEYKPAMAKPSDQVKETVVDRLLPRRQRPAYTRQTTIHTRDIKGRSNG